MSRGGICFSTHSAFDRSNTSLAITRNKQSSLHCLSFNWRTFSLRRNDHASRMDTEIPLPERWCVSVSAEVCVWISVYPSRTNLKDKQRVNDSVEFCGILLEQNNSREHWHKKTRSLLISFYSWFSLSLRVWRWSVWRDRDLWCVWTEHSEKWTLPYRWNTQESQELQVPSNRGLRTKKSWRHTDLFWLVSCRLGLFLLRHCRTRSIRCHFFLILIWIQLSFELFFHLFGFIIRRGIFSVIPSLFLLVLFRFTTNEIIVPFVSEEDSRGWQTSVHCSRAERRFLLPLLQEDCSAMFRFPLPCALWAVERSLCVSGNSRDWEN